MPKFIYIACLLLANFHPSQLDKDSTQNAEVQDDSTDEKKGDLATTVSQCSENVSQPTIGSPSQEATIGWNVTLECVSQHGSPPITYMLYKERNKKLNSVTKDKAGEKALFNFTINSNDELGVYKCKVADNCLNSMKYSTGFIFQVRKDKIVFIVAPLLAIVLAVAILLLVLWCIARKSKPTSTQVGSLSTTYRASENCTTYEKIASESEEVAYTEVKFDTKDEDYRKMIVEVDPAVNYAEVAIRK